MHILNVAITTYIRCIPNVQDIDIYEEYNG